MIKKWEYSKVDENTVSQVARRNNISELLAKILLNRGFETDDKISNFLNPKLENLYDPFLLNDMDTAASTLIEAYKNNEKITIYGDYDVDGITSVSVLRKFLTELGANVEHYLPSRLEEGYGLNNNAIKKIFENGTKVLVTVDCGISAYEEVEYAKSLGIKVIITDHHECPEKLPKALAVVDAKRPDSTYPFEALAGVGVTFKLIHAISIKLELDRKKYLKYLDIVALGTVADIVPLKNENRIIVNYGLILMRQTKNLGLQALIKVSGFELNEHINSSVISFGLAPRINACGRMGKADLALQLLLTNDAEEAYRIALELNDINKERQKVEKEIIDEAINIIESEKLYEKNAIIIAKENWHHGVIGIVASKITELYYKPTVLICLENGIGKGSGRSIEGFDLHDALTESSEYLLKYGGHEMAIGLSIEEKNIEAFINKMEEIATEKNVKEFQPVIRVDAEVMAEDITHKSIQDISLLEPYGEANPAPLFVYKNVKIDGVRLLSNDKHVKLVLKDKNSLFDAIAFNVGTQKYSLKIGDKIDIIHALEINSFNGIDKIQLNVKDIKKSL